MLRKALMFLAVPVVLGGFAVGGVLAAPDQQSPATPSFVGPIQFVGKVQELPAAPSPASTSPTSTSPTSPTSPSAPGNLTGMWKVQGLKVDVTADTKVGGSPQVNSVVRVVGTIKGDGVVMARLLAAVRGHIEFSGFVQSMPQGGVVGTWKIEGLTVNVTASTQVKGNPQVGSFVHVEGLVDPDGVVQAKEIRARDIEPALRPNRARGNGPPDRDRDGPPFGVARGHDKRDKHDRDDD